MKGVKGSLYLGDFIGDRDVETTWLDEKVQGWAESVRALSRVARNHPKSAYAGLQKLIQQEWAFVQRVISDIWDAFGPVEKSVRDMFMPELFQGIVEGNLDWGSPACQWKRWVWSSQIWKICPTENWTVSCVITGHLVVTRRGKEDYSTAYHTAYKREGREEVRKKNIMQ